MIFNATLKIKRNKHASIHTLLGVMGGEGACISELAAMLKKQTRLNLTEH